MKLNMINMAYRNVARQGKRSLMLALSMAFGVMIITLVNSLTVGMANSVESNFSKALGGHVYISGEIVTASNRNLAVIEDRALVVRALAPLADRIVQQNKRSSSAATLSFGGQAVQGTVAGVDFSVETNVFDNMARIAGDVSLMSQAKMLIVPEKVANELGVTAGESILIRASTVTGQQNLVEWTIAAVIADPEGLNEVTNYANLSDVNGLIGLPPEAYQQLNLVLGQISDMDAIRDRLLAYFGEQASVQPADEENPMKRRMMGMSGNLIEHIDEPWQGTRFTVTNLNDAMSDVLSLIGALEAISLAVFVVMLLIIMVGITNAYRMVILERVQEIGTLRAMGAQRSWIFRLFIAESVLTALMGASVGIVCAFILAAVLGTLTLPGGGPLAMFAVTGQLQFPLSWLAVLVPLVVTALVAAGAVYFPARKAANMAPGDALRAAS